jgi:hypothetical protein
LSRPAIVPRFAAALPQVRRPVVIPHVGRRGRGGWGAARRRHRAREEERERRVDVETQTAT